MLLGHHASGVHMQNVTMEGVKIQPKLNQHSAGSLENSTTIPTAYKLMQFQY